MTRAASIRSENKSQAAPSVAARVRLQLLNAPRLLLATGQVYALERKDAALLALLVIEGPAPRTRAATLLWPDIDDDRARNNLRQRLFRLRKAAACDVVRAGSVLSLAESVAHDLGSLATRLAADPDAATGELLGELDYGDCAELLDWVEAAREKWRQARRAALAEVASRLEAEGHVAQALRYAQRLVGDDPSLEHAHRRVMRLHYLRGDRAAALAAYERCCEALRQHVGAVPGRETLELARLIEQSGTLATNAAMSVPKPVAVLRPPRLVGREIEWAQLEHAWDARRILIASGEPGIGKTRLLTDFACTRRGAITVGARPGDARVPYALLARWLRAGVSQFSLPAEAWAVGELARIAPELGAVADGKGDPLRLRQAMLSALAAWTSAGLAAVAIDDLQFADEATLEMLPALAGETRMALRWMFAVRGNEMPASLGTWLDACDAEVLERVELPPLTLAATEALLQSLALPQLDAAAWAAPLYRHTGGNPMFMLETLLAIAAGAPPASTANRLPVPTNIGALIEKRLAQLSPAALKLARVAALAGPDFSADLAAQVLGVHALDLTEPWRELETAQVIRDNAFAHDLIFEATLRSVPRQIAQLMNRAIAGFLETRGAPSARVAQHWSDAQEWQRAGAAFAAAALDARRLSQRADEVELWQRACECYERGGEHDPAFDARRESIESLILIHGVERATQVVSALLQEARTEPQRAAALTAHAHLRLMAADHVAGVTAAREAYELARGLDSPWPQFEAARLLAIGLSQQERAAEALPLIEPFRELVEREGTPEQRGKFWADYAYALNSARRLRQTADALTRAIANARALGDLGELATLTSNLALVQGNLGRVEAALEQALRARALRGQLGEAGGPPIGAIDMYVGMYSAMLGRYRDALASFDAALEVFAHDRQPLWLAVASNHKAGVLLDLGQAARAQKALEYAAPSIDSVRARRTTLLARIERFLGRSGERQIRDALVELGEHGDRYVRMLTQIDEAAGLSAPQAVALCGEVRREAEHLEYAGVAVKARLWGARHLLRSGDAAASAADLHQLLPHLDTVRPADMYFPEAWWIAFEVFEANHEAAAATAALKRGYDWIHDVALPNVPDEFRDGFLDRNPISRAIRTTATRRLRA